MWSRSRLGPQEVDGLRPVFSRQLISDYCRFTDWGAGRGLPCRGVPEHVVEARGRPLVLSGLS